MYGNYKLKIQSSDVNLAVMQMATEHTENQSDTHQENPPPVVATVNSDLNKYLNRPVLIRTINWSENSNFTDDFYPWYLYFNHTSIRKRIDNYAFLRCKLNIRVLISASPFYYGAGQFSYRPFSDEVVCAASTTKASALISRSQRPSFNIYPQQSMGGEMQLPFLFHKEFANITTPTDLQMLGAINAWSFDILRNANSVVGEAATIQVFAWAEDVELSGPTVALALQSKDEYTGIVSKPASALAHWAGRLSDIPVIGRFATATSLASGAVAAIASLFGYTNVPNIEKQSAFRPTSTPLLATTDIGVATEKLTLDSKNELTIDNSAYSCGDKDPLIIKNLCARESYLTSFTWTAVNAPQDLLWNSRVTPSLYKNIAYSYGTTPVTGYEITMTPMAMVANLFQYWRGDIKFRFVFICSQYHRGKVRIVWDPKSIIGLSTSAYTEVYNKVVDLTQEQDVSITIPYNQATAFLDLQTEPITDTSIYGTAYVVPSNDNNGILSVVVLNKQTSPVASAPISVLVYVSAADIDFEAPSSLTNFYSPFALQSKDTDLSNPSTNDLFETKGEDGHLNLVYMGEKIVSLRQLMRRANHSITMACTDFYQSSTHLFAIMNRMPLYPGFDPNGIAVVYKLGAPASTAPYNYSSYTALNWVTQCFVGYRGSIIWNINCTGTNVASTLSARRSRNTLESQFYIRANTQVSPSENVSQYHGLIRNYEAPMGVSLTNGRIQPSIAVLVPWYSNYKFAATTASQRTLGRSQFGTTDDAIKVDAFIEATATNPANQTTFETYCGIGTDYDPVFFLNVPVLYWTPSLPLPVY